jgi:hypothetical protein
MTDGFVPGRYSWRLGVRRKGTVNLAVIAARWRGSRKEFLASWRLGVIREGTANLAESRKRTVCSVLACAEKGRPTWR